MHHKKYKDIAGNMDRGNAKTAVSNLLFSCGNSSRNVGHFYRRIFQTRLRDSFLVRTSNLFTVFVVVYTFLLVTFLDLCT